MNLFAEVAEAAPGHRAICRNEAPARFSDRDIGDGKNRVQGRAGQAESFTHRRAPVMIPAGPNYRCTPPLRERGEGLGREGVGRGGAVIGNIPGDHDGVAGRELAGAGHGRFQQPGGVNFSVMAGALG